MSPELASFLSGLVGALLGILASWGLYLAGRTREERAGVRAVLAEVSVNDAALQSIGIGNPHVGPIGSSVYQANLPKVAARLTDHEMVQVAAPFAFAPWCEDIRQRIVKGEPVHEADREALRMVQQMFVTATTVLQARS